MRNGPEAIRAVSVEPTAEMVANPTPGHALQGGQEHCFRLLVAAESGILQQEHEVGRLGKLWHVRVGRAVAEAAMVGIEAVGQAIEHFVGVLAAGWLDRFGHLLLQLAFDQRGHDLGIFAQPLGVCFPGLFNCLKHAYQPRHAALVARRIVGPAHHGTTVGCEKHRQGPTAGPWGANQLIVDLQGRHVDLVNVGALFPINLDANEMLVQYGGDLLVHERFSLHHMAPVTTRITNRQKDQLLLGLGLGQCLFTPGIPVDRVVGVQQQIQAGLAGQTIQMLHCRRRFITGRGPGTARPLGGTRTFTLATEGDRKRQQNKQGQQQPRRGNVHPLAPSRKWEFFQILGCGWKAQLLVKSLAVGTAGQPPGVWCDALFDGMPTTVKRYSRLAGGDGIRARQESDETEGR